MFATDAGDGDRTVTGRSAVDALTHTAGRSVARGLIFLIQLYRHMVSPLRPATCRFVPTCSQYAVDALNEYGLLRGAGWLRSGSPSADHGTKADGIRYRIAPAAKGIAKTPATLGRSERREGE